jgi:NAD(P)-dependent dehydrogenase (short-subunit alcohol dehydrogenase family)
MDAGLNPLDQNRVAVVTGAASGIGRATAMMFARHGMPVGLVDRDASALERTLGEVQGLGRQSRAFVADCADRGQLQAAFTEIAQTLGDVHVLVNNVGMAPRTGLLADQTDFAELDALIAVNLKAAIICSRAVVDGMKRAGRGRIINVSSDAAMMGDLASWAYASAKAGVLGFTRALARELAPCGITVNAVAPGFTRTAMTDQVSEASRQRILASVPMGAVIEPEDIAHAIVFLSGEGSRFITGQTLAVNGGRWMC